jgi:peptidoglycan/xylan/chitin deacetylase (PgdA/CDA1 family)
VPILEYHDLGHPPAGASDLEPYVDRTTLAPKPIVISFDDGYRPQFTFALPTLRKHGWAGALNLRAAGWELAAHAIHHLNLTELGAEELKEEVAGSRKILQEEFKVPVDNVS